MENVDVAPDLEGGRKRLFEVRLPNFLQRLICRLDLGRGASGAPVLLLHALLPGGRLSALSSLPLTPRL